jgi:hypothetical protein
MLIYPPSIYKFFFVALRLTGAKSWSLLGRSVDVILGHEAVHRGIIPPSLSQKLFAPVILPARNLGLYIPAFSGKPTTKHATFVVHNALLHAHSSRATCDWQNTIITRSFHDYKRRNKTSCKRSPTSLASEFGTKSGGLE